jgi:hypothetical protein
MIRRLFRKRLATPNSNEVIEWQTRTGAVLVSTATHLTYSHSGRREGVEVEIRRFEHVATGHHRHSALRARATLNFIGC